MLDYYEDALPFLQDHLPDWWAKGFVPLLLPGVYGEGLYGDGTYANKPESSVTPTILSTILGAVAGPADELSGGLEAIYADQTLLTATLAGLAKEYAYVYGVEQEQLPPTVDGLRSYIQLWAGWDGSLESAEAVLTALLLTPQNTVGTQLVFPGDGSGFTFPGDGSGLTLFALVLTVGPLTFPPDGTGLLFPADGSGILFPNITGWVVIFEHPETFTWTVQTLTYLTFDRAAFARAVERLRQAHDLPAVLTEVDS